ncbi:MAG: type IX secretion system membrane protein PorP/SprF [Tannerella sp.]|jgi:type IX secretion system PorP/SprF family membrane protein|nr:type IX secretion system membrane protein PorP/SprF [Tannerella sp.]
MKRFWYIVLFIGVSSSVAIAQTDDALFSQYFSALGYYNPAYAGKSGDLYATALYRMQWLGVKNAPKSALLTADMPWKYGKLNQGVGIVVMSESAGLDERMNAGLQYAVKLKLGKGTMSIGIQAGMINHTFRGDSIYIPAGSDEIVQDDEAITKSELDAMGLDFAAGVMYYTEKYFIGIASAHLLAPKLNLDENFERKVERSYNLTAGYNIPLKNTLFELQPTVMTFTNLQMVSADVTARAVYNKVYNGGLGVRVSDNGKVNAATLYLGALIKGFRIGYAYEFPTSAMNSATTGSHEFMVTYNLKLNNNKGKKNKHKSIRYL